MGSLGKMFSMMSRRKRKRPLVKYQETRNMAMPHQRFGDPIFCSAERGTMVFAILNLICTSILSVCGTVGTALVPQMLADDEELPMEHERLMKTFLPLLMDALLMLAATLVAYISLVFAVFLVYGFFKKYPGFIKAYLCYGVFVYLISIIAVVVALIPEKNGGYGVPIYATMTAIALLAIYALVLVMIRTTYKKIVQPMHVQYCPQPLKAAEAGNM